MPKEFCQVLINAKNIREVNKISNILVKKRLIAGSLILKGPSRYWWKDKIVEKEYYNLQAFSLIKNKSKIISEVKKFIVIKVP